MTLIRKLASALCLAFLFTTLSSNSQTATGTIDSVTGNLVYTTSTAGYTNPPPNNNWTGYNWSGFVGTTSTGGGYSGGSAPGWNSTTGTFMFGYNQGTINYSMAVQNALANAGTGVQVKGLQYSWQYYNQDMSRGSLSSTISLTNTTGQVLQSYTDTMPQTTAGWTNFSAVKYFATPYAPSSLGNLNVSFTGKDDRWWAGYYGPQLRAIDVRLAYGVDPCATNPAYSPSCAGFDKVLTSTNLVPNPGAYAYGGFSVNNSYAINTALASAGSGAMIHGFSWGYVANANGPYCAFWFFDCWDNRTPYVNTSVSITDSAGATLYSVNRHYENSYNTTNYSYLFPTSRQMSTLGNFNFYGTTNDQAYLGSMWSTALYTVDPCVANPLYSPTCSGYAAAFAKLTPSTTSTSTAYVGTTSVTSSSLVETSPSGTIDQTNPQTSSSTSTTSSSTSTSTTTQDTTQTTTSVATADPAQPASTTPTPAGAPAQTTTTSSSSTSSSSGGSSAGPSKLAMSVLKSAQEKDKATQAAAVQSAAKTLENATQSSQASSNAAIAMNQDMSANSATAAATFAGQSTQASIQSSMQFTQQQTVQQAGTQSQQTNRIIQQTTQQTQMQAYSNEAQLQQGTYTPPKPVVDIQQQTTSSGTGLTFGRNMFSYNPVMSSINPGVSITQPQPVYQFRLDPRQFEIEAPQAPVASFGGTSKAGNPLSEIIMQQRFESMQSNITPAMSSVNKNVQSNELAGGVDITSIATVPAGFNAYSFVLRDAAFYEPKEVYKNQRTVDNERVLRGLTRGSDSLHQQMVDQQYK